MNLRNIVLGLGLATIVSGGMVAPGIARAQESKAPVTEVINNKGLEKDKFEKLMNDMVEGQQSSTDKLSDIINLLSQINDNSGVTKAELEDILDATSPDLKQTQAISETLSNIISNLEKMSAEQGTTKQQQELLSEMIQKIKSGSLTDKDSFNNIISNLGDDPQVMKSGLEKLVESVGIDKAIEYVKEAEPIEILGLLSAIGLGGGFIAYSRASRKHEYGDSGYQKDYIKAKNSSNPEDKASYIKERLGISDEGLAELMSMPDEKRTAKMLSLLDKMSGKK